MKSSIFTVLFLSSLMYVQGQDILQQYFDGADTSWYNSLIIQMDTSANNVWQVGSPQKNIFNEAASLPNAILSDTIDSYPVNANSAFEFKIVPEMYFWGILALQWKQKLDFDPGKDGGIVSYSKDYGQTWYNVFNNPYVYNFYGYDPANADTLESGEFAFSGTDSTWKDIWLCFDVSFLMDTDTVIFKYNLKSDSIDNKKEGWMIDNMMAHLTIFHTISKNDQPEYFNVFPTATNDIVHIELQKLPEYHIIESIDVIDVNGQVMKHYNKAPSKFYIHLGAYPSGLYYLIIQTNKKTGTFPVILQKN